ncbi:MAG: hypothetical protein ABIN61_08950 [candidate division WOR-3 bacterium]
MGKLKVVLSLILVFLSISLFAKGIGLLPFKLVGVETDVGEAIYQLIRTEFSSYGDRLVLPEEIERSLGEKVECQDKGCAAQIGRQLGLEEVVFGSITKLGEKHIISAVAIKSQTGEIFFSDKATATTPEDLDVCVSRLVKGIKEGKKVGETVEIEKITEEEVWKAEKRKKSFYAGGIVLNVSKLFAGYGDVQGKTLYGYGFVGWYETPNLVGELNARVLVLPLEEEDTLYLGNRNMTESKIGVSILYFFSRKDFSPYLGGGLALTAIQRGYYESGIGMALEVAGGLALFRTYDFRFLLEGRISTNFQELFGDKGPHVNGILSLGILYTPKEREGCCGFRL